MSGGHWNYDQARIERFAENLAPERDELAAKFGVDFVTPLVVALTACANLLHDLDWDICGDRGIEDPASRLQAFKDVLREAVR